MKQELRKTTVSALAAILCLSVAPAGLAQFNAEVVYDNTQSTTEAFTSLGEREFGDEITLETPDNFSNTVMTEFKWEVWGSGLPPGAEGQLQFYANDGDSGAPMTPLGDGPYSFEIGSEAATTRTLSGIAIDVPDSFTWTVEYSNIQDGEAGLTLSHPPEVGGNFPDFWQRTQDGDWTLATLPDTAANFTAQVTAVPEPSAILIGLFGGLAFLGYRRLGRKASS